MTKAKKRKAREQALKNLHALANMWTLMYPELGPVTGIDCDSGGNRLNVWFNESLSHWQRDMKPPKLFNDPNIRIIVRYCRLIIQCKHKPSMSYQDFYDVLSKA